LGFIPKKLGKTEKRKRLVLPRQALEGLTVKSFFDSPAGPKRLEGQGAGAGQFSK